MRKMKIDKKTGEVNFEKVDKEIFTALCRDFLIPAMKHELLGYWEKIQAELKKARISVEEFRKLEQDIQDLKNAVWNKKESLATKIAENLLRDKEKKK